MSEITLLSWNVRGLNNKFKRSLLFKYLNTHKPHILFLQETHLTGSKVLALRRAWVRQAFHATYSTYARGVAILINKSLPCKVVRVITDPGGRYIILLLEIHTVLWALVNVYLPPQ